MQNQTNNFGTFCVKGISRTYSNSPDSNGDGDPNHSGSKSKTKRVRTTFTDEQLNILQANFHIDSNPDGQVLLKLKISFNFLDCMRIS